MLSFKVTNVIQVFLLTGRVNLSSASKDANRSTAQLQLDCMTRVSNYDKHVRGLPTFGLKTCRGPNPFFSMVAPEG